MTRILVYARGAVGKQMGSTGIRSLHAARVLAEQLPEAQVTLAAPNVPDIESPHPRLRLTQYGGPWRGLMQMLKHDVVVCRNVPPAAIPLFFSKRFVLDLYAVFPIEWMSMAAQRVPERRRRSIWAAANRHYMNFQVTMGDSVVCSSERQRDFWVGALAALGLITPAVYDSDPTLRRLIDVVPYGVQPGRPSHTKQVLKGIVPGIRESDTVLIWNGSIMEWFDAETVIRAMVEVSRVRDDVKLFFLGTDHPDLVAGVVAGPPREALELSKTLDLYERSVFFNVGWVPYAEIGNYLSEADIGVCAGFSNLETRYAFRTRMVDLFWAELPIICTRGDVLAERVERDPLGIAVEPGNVGGIADAILRLASDRGLYEQCRRKMPAIKDELSWERVLAPLVELCRTGRSIAPPKRQRYGALLRRALAYGATHAWQQVITRERDA